MLLLMMFPVKARLAPPARLSRHAADLLLLAPAQPSPAQSCPVTGKQSICGTAERNYVFERAYQFSHLSHPANLLTLSPQPPVLGRDLPKTPCTLSERRVDL